MKSKDEMGELIMMKRVRAVKWTVHKMKVNICKIKLFIHVQIIAGWHTGCKLGWKCQMKEDKIHERRQRS